MRLSPATRLGSYEILAQLGAGGMGEVYRARDTRLGREVAIKVLPEAFARDPDRLARFQREAQLLAALNHPNIAAIHGLEEQDGLRYLVLEYVPGETLAERVGAGLKPAPSPLPMEEALEISKQIAEALEAAHEKGIMHRDLKPANIKVTPEGQVKVLDFGLAKAFESEASAADLSRSPTLSMAATRAGVILGTAAYMSPEQAKGRPLDERADIWAFGCVLWEMLVGRQLFSGETVTDMLAAVIRAEPDWNALPPETPPAIRQLLSRCLQKDSKRRLRHIGDARIEIEDALSVPAGAVQRIPEKPELTARRELARWPLLVAIAVLAALAGAGVVWKLLPAPQAPAHLVVTLPAGESLALGEGPAMALSPDGRWLAYVVHRGATQQLYVRSIAEFQAKPIPGTDGAFNPFFSPDSQWIGFVAAGKMKKVPLGGGSAATICNGQGVWGASWATDGNIYFAERWQGESLLRVPAAGGTPQVISRPDAKKGESCHRWPHALPGGQGVLFTVGAGATFDDARIALLDVKTGQWKTLVEGGSNPRYVRTGHLLYVRAGTLFAIPFDLKKLEVTGTPVPVLEGVTTSTANGEGQFSVAEDGSLVYVPGGTAHSERKLVWVDRKGTNKPVTELRRAYEDLDLSPDGRRLALTIEGPTWNIWVHDLERGTLTRFTHEQTNTDPQWTPDGKRIVFTSFREGQYGLFWKPADGSGPEERLVAGPNFLHPYSFSADGRFLAYSDQHPKTDSDIWVLPMEGERKPQPFLRTPFQEMFPALSPDGRWIAYQSNESGRPEIYLQPFPGPGGRIQISTDGAWTPLWASTGRELFYLNAEKVMAVPIETKPTIRAGAPRVMFQLATIFTGHPYDHSPNAERFVFITPSEQQGASAQIYVVLNWFEELKSRVSSGKK